MPGRAPLLTIVILACGGRGDDTLGPTGTTDTWVQSTTTPVTSTALGRVVQGGVVTCSDPTQRATLGPFDRRTAQSMETEGAYLWASGVISADFDSDGALDFFVPGETTHQLWFSKLGQGPMDVSFDDQALARMGGLDLDYTVGGTAADIDGDGDPDLVLSRWERHNLILLNEGGAFIDVTPDEMKAYTHKTQSASVGDLDLDGDLDLFFGSYGETPYTYYDPYMAAADPAELYRAEAGNTWTDLAANLSPEVHDAYTFSSGFYDLNGDLLPEILVANDFGKVRPSVLLTNNGNFSFTPDISWHPNWEDMGMGVGDVDGDLLPDILLSSWRSVDVLTQISAGESMVWAQAGSAWGVVADYQNRNQAYGWGSDWADLDNDTDLDGIVLFGHWDDYDGSMNPEIQVDALFEQTAPQVFEQRGAEWGVNDQGPGRGFITVDLNNDGWLDLIKRQPGERTLLYIARCGEQSWARVRLSAPPPNTEGIGATVRATIGDKTLIRWITAGSTGMYGGQPIEAHFGLGDAERIDRLEVFWPDGAVSTFANIDANQVLTVERFP